MLRTAIVVAALSLAVPAALAADTDRAVLTPGLAATITTVPQYTRTAFDGDSGSWQGPNCVPRGRLDLARPLSLTWAVGVYRAGSAVAAGELARTFDWKVVQATTVRLPHVVGGRTIGTIPAVLVVTGSPSGTGYHEASVAFRLVGVRFAAAKTWSHGNAHPCLVDGGGPVDEWHRRVARQALEGIHIEGNLPPVRVTARRSGRIVRGAVTDVNGHPLVGVTVALERRTSTRWKTVRRAKTSASGAYAVRVSAAGLHRVATSSGGTTARSRTLRA
jgi:hypothetical protein